MPIPKEIKVKHEKLPITPGVYLFKDKKGKVVYVGKATNLRSRVGSYFSFRHSERSEESHTLLKARGEISRSPRGSLEMTNSGGGRPIEEMLHEVRRIDYVVTDSVIEALILEANLIKKHLPKYNVKDKDDKSFLYVVITKEEWPKVMLVRGQELSQRRHPERSVKRGVERSYTVQGVGFLHSPRGSVEMTNWVWKVFGPYTSASSIRAALDLIRKWFPWSTCVPLSRHLERSAKSGVERSHTMQGKRFLHSPRPPRRIRRVEAGGSVEMTKIGVRPCFDYNIGRCPGVCIGAISRREYMKNIRNVILMLEGKKARVMKNVELRMKNAARAEKFEEAEMWRRKLFALQHIRDVAVLTQDTNRHEHGARTDTNGIDVFGRIEGYDVSNISGTAAVGALVVFQNGEPRKSEYRRFKIKGVSGINDVAMMREVLKRRFLHTPIRHLERSAERGVERSHTMQGVGFLHSPRGSVEMTKTRDRWPLPDLIVIDGGWGQVNAARGVIKDLGLKIKVIGIAKGFKRKQDRPVFDKDNPELARIVDNYKGLLLRVRDEAHRFAVAYHRKVRKRAFSTR